MRRIWVTGVVLATALAPASAHAGTLAFTSSGFAVGDTPVGVAAADFNRDGHVDLVTANISDSTASVALGDGAGGFAAAGGSPIATGGGPSIPVTADFNGDGNADFAVTNQYDNTVTVKLGDGHGGFTTAPNSPDPVSGGSTTFGLVTADFNGDGVPDVAVSNFNGNSVSVLLNDGTGRLSSMSPVAVGGNPSAITTADFNGDGNADLAVANVTSNTASVLLGNGAGGLTAATPLTVGSGPRGITAADFDGDGRPDLAVTNESNSSVSVALGAGDGTFAPATAFTVPAGGGAWGVVTADLNGDHHLDLAVSQDSSSKVAFLLGDGKGGFASAGSPVATGLVPEFPVTADFDGDGKPDLATPNYSGASVTVLRNATNEDPPPPLPAPRYAIAPGPVWGNGSGTWGELGTGAAVDRLSPFAAPIPDAVAAATGSFFSLVVRSDGSVWSSGRNTYGQLGDGSSLDHRLSFAPVAGMNGVTAVAAGASHALALRSDGTVWAWGRGDLGQLGVGSTPTVTDLPVQVQGLSDVIAIAAGNNSSAALRADGSVWTWGANDVGQLGDGTTTQRNVPVRTNLTNIVAIAVGSGHMLAVTSLGTVYAWGANASGQLGDGSTVQRTSPVQVSGLTSAVAVAASGADSMALRSDKTIRTWGDNTYGELGIGSTTPTSGLATPTTSSAFSAIGAGGTAMYGVRTTGGVYAWGYNGNGRLGTGNTTQQNSPTAIGMRNGGLLIGAGTSSGQVLYVARPNLTTSATKLTYAALAPGQTSGSQTLTITSYGMAPLVIGTVDVVGSDGDEFTKAGDSCQGQTLAPPATCTINVRYKPVVDHSTNPGGTGVASIAYLRIASNSPDGAKLVTLDPPSSGADQPAPASPATVAAAAAPALSNAPATAVHGARPATCIATRAKRGAVVSCSLQGVAPWRLSIALRRDGHTFATTTRTVHVPIVRLRLRAKHALRAGAYTLNVTVRSARGAQRFTEAVRLR